MRKIYLLVAVLLIATIVFGQTRSISKNNYDSKDLKKEQVSEKVKNNLLSIESTDNSKGVKAIACPGTSLGGNSYDTPNSMGNATGLYKIASTFSTVGGTIENVTLWGINAFNDGTAWGECNSDPMVFNIGFYTNNAGAVGTLIQEFTNISVARVATAEMFMTSYTVYQYNITLPTAITATSGFIVVNAVGAADCWFLAANAPTTGTGSALTYDGTIWTAAASPMAFCIGGTAPTCAAPTALTSSNITTSEATMAWTSTATAWEVAYGLTGFNVATATPTAVTSATYNISGLNAGTYYDVYVRTNCTGENSIWAGPYTFRTLPNCATITALPFNESFEGSIFAPDCWTNVKTAGTAAGLWTSVTTGTYPTCTPQQGSKMTKFASYNYAVGTKGILATPKITIPTGYLVNFFMYRDAGEATSADSVNVYYNATQDLTGATLVGTAKRRITDAPATVEGWYEYEFPLVAGDFHVIFEGVSAYGNNIYIDNISVKVIPTCEKPTLVNVSSILTTTANIAWTSTGTAWEIAYGLTGFDIATATPVATTTNPHSLTSLTPGATYDVYVRNVCSSSDKSEWTTKLTFTTECNTVALPFSESFEGITFAPECWKNIKTAGSGAGLWVSVVNGTDPTCTPQDGSKMAMFGCYNYSAGTKGILVTPKITIPVNYLVDFFMYRDAGLNTYADSVNVYYNATPNLTGATLIGTAKRRITDAPATVEGWYEYEFPLVAGDFYVIFEGVSNFGNNIFMDNISINPLPTCAKPTLLNAVSVASTTASIAWTSTASSWEIAYGEAGFDIATATPIATTTNPHTLNGLTPGTTYDVYVRTVCTGENSVWTNKITFTTSCLPISTLPHSEGFESMSTATGFDCWTVKKNTAAQGGLNGASLADPSDDSWFVCEPTSFTTVIRIHNGQRSAAIGYAATDFNWLISPDFILPATGNYDVKYYLWYFSSLADDWITKFNTQIYVDGAWTSLATFDSEASNDSLWANQHVHSLAAYQNKTIKIGFVFEYNDGFELAIDDFSIDFSSGIDNATSKVITVYPNPANETINFNNVEGKNIVIYNALGQVVINTISSSNNQIINTSNFAEGAYIARIGNQSYKFSVIK